MQKSKKRCKDHHGFRIKTEPLNLQPYSVYDFVVACQGWMMFWYIGLEHVVFFVFIVTRMCLEYPRWSLAFVLSSFMHERSLRM